MKLIRCERGHYYDVRQHSSCPSCGVAGLDVAAAQGSAAPAEAMVTQVRGQAGPVADVGVTVAMVRKKIGIDPVVGWLVCVRGPEKGRDYRVRSERNAIGRGADMAICINGDEAISRENHAYISFNPRKGSFRIAPGDGRGMTYLNGEEVDVPMPLQAYDRIELGQTHLLFVPLCGERFGWENGEE
ncbi:FHA domain-containing protein [Methylomonas sp. SURF-2]|uniref:FHA domain-containing protein n=1 Tax=Methylomonas subterranea TaxID=2952225 RepID=A0ABT1TI09_9GAMM|nr:FHA domain-containing protein [Methylomonas sp. SURF-2]MCQ8105096.1 FHA domain-containing protein [Methylomonas sp. SURF-2]